MKRFTLIERAQTNASGTSRVKCPGHTNFPFRVCSLSAGYSSDVYIRSAETKSRAGKALIERTRSQPEWRGKDSGRREASFQNTNRLLTIDGLSRLINLAKIDSYPLAAVEDSGYVRISSDIRRKAESLNDVIQEVGDGHSSDDGEDNITSLEQMAISLTMSIKEEKGCGDCLRLKNTTLKVVHITLDQTIAVSKGNYSTVGDLCL